MALLAADSLLKVPPCLLPVGVSWWLSGKEHACNAGDMGLIPGLQRSPGGGNGNPLQYSCLEKPMGRGAWQATAHGVIMSETQLSKRLSMHLCSDGGVYHSGKYYVCVF